MEKRTISDKIVGIALYPAMQCLENIRYNPGKGLVWGVVSIVTAPVTIPVLAAVIHYDLHCGK